MNVLPLKHGLPFAIIMNPHLWLFLLNLWTSSLLYQMTPMQLLGHHFLIWHLPFLPHHQSFLQQLYHLCLPFLLSTLLLLQDQFIMLSRSTSLFLLFMASRSTLLLCLYHLKISSMRSISTVQNGLYKSQALDLLFLMEFYSTLSTLQGLSGCKDFFSSLLFQQSPHPVGVLEI